MLVFWGEEKTVVRGQKSLLQQGREQQPQQTQLQLNSHLHGFLFGIGARATFVGGESGGDSPIWTRLVKGMDFEAFW